MTPKPAPASVVILGLGPSLEAYVDAAKRTGSRRVLADEVWGINAAGDIINCDRVFHMDDVRIQEARARARPDSNIAAMLPWLRAHPGPVYTSRPHEDYPGLVAYPLAEVMNACGGVEYFNSTAAYAVAFAIYLGVQRISLFGFDFTYPDAHHAEKGRACVEFYLGLARARGVIIGLPDRTSLMDACAPRDERLYGYDTLNVAFGGEDDEPISVTMTPRADVAGAEAIERRYDHGRHPSPLLSDRKVRPAS